MAKMALSRYPTVACPPPPQILADTRGRFARLSNPLSRGAVGGDAGGSGGTMQRDGGRCVAGGTCRRDAAGGRGVQWRIAVQGRGGMAVFRRM